MSGAPWKRCRFSFGAGWLSPVGNAYPAKKWTVAPGLRGYFADQREAECKRAMPMVALIQHSARDRRGEREAAN